MRVLVRVSSKSQQYPKAWSSYDDVIALSLDALKDFSILDQAATPQPRLLAVDRYNIFTLIVFDIFNDTYDIRLGHLPEHNKLPLSKVYMSRVNDQESIKASRATEGERRMVNAEVCKLHMLNENSSVLPFKADHLNGKAPVYVRHPRPSTTQVQQGQCTD